MKGSAQLREIIKGGYDNMHLPGVELIKVSTHLKEMMKVSTLQGEVMKGSTKMWKARK